MEGAVTNLFKSETAYKNAFETASESLGQLDIALAATAAWNELASLSAYVKPLIAADVQQTLEELHKESKHIILFTISYENNTGVSYPATIANKEADGDPVSLAPYTKTEGTTTTVYFTLDLAPAAVTMKDTSGKEYGTTDPAGTLFYEAWRNFVSDTTRSSAVQNTDVKIVLYTDIGLWQTKSFTANEDTKTAWGNFQHTKQAGNSTNYYFIQNLRMYSGKVSLDLNDNTVHLLVNKDSHNGDVDGFSNHIYNSNNAALTIMNGTIDAKGEKEDIGIGGSDREYYFIEAKGPLTMENVVLNTAEQQTGLTTDGIKVKYVVGSKIGGPESCGDATIKNVTINGMGARRGIKIEGGYANIQDTTIDANIGIEITGMGKKGEEIEQKNVSLKNCTINGATRAINIASTTNARIVSIEDCKLASRSRSGQALNISASNGKVQIDSIKDSSFASAGTAIQSQGTSSNQVQIGTIEGCTITGDKLLDTSGTYVDVYGLKLEYTTVGTMKNCTVVASADSSMLGTAVSLGTGSSLHLVCAGEDNNWFAAFGSDKSVLFSGAGIVTVQVGTGSPSDGVSADEFDISNTPANFSRETEFHGGYDCYKLVIPKESA